MDDARRIHAGAFFLQAVSVDIQFLVPQSQQVQDRGMEIRNGDLIFHGRQANFIGRAEHAFPTVFRTPSLRLRHSAAARMQKVPHSGMHLIPRLKSGRFSRGNA